MRKLVVLIILLVCCSAAFAQKRKTLLAVFPHPDDESAIGEVLLKYSRMGYKVQLIIITDGKDGTRVTKIPAGDELGRLRKDESRCAAKTIGIEEPIFLGIERLDTKIGVGKYFGEHKGALGLLKEKVSQVNPDLILTFGPDGDTSHSEHIVAGSLVTELLLQEGWVDKYPLYYVAWSREQTKALEDLEFVDDRYFNVRITYTQEEEDKALEMMPCYVTQYTPEEIKEDGERKRLDKSNVIHFRQLAVKKGLRNKF